MVDKDKENPDSGTENSVNENPQAGEENSENQQNISSPVKPKSNKMQYIEIGIIIVGIILIAIASVQIKSIAHVKWNDFSEVALPLSIIFIVTPSLLYFKKLRSMKPALSITIIVIIGIVLLYYLLGPYKMFVVRFGLLGDVIVEYLIGIFLLIFMVSHMTKVHLLKNKNQ
jgi:hypothetical protein